MNKPEEIEFSTSSNVSLDARTIDKLIEKALITTRKRYRLCAHQSNEDLLHEMFIVHPFGSYVRAHRHLGRVESFLIIMGDVDLVLFTSSGEIDDIIELGDFNSGKNFYYRIAANVYHTIIIKSEVLVFQETTLGPFIRENTEFAQWAPKESELANIETYQAHLMQAMKSFKKDN